MKPPVSVWVHGCGYVAVCCGVRTVWHVCPSMLSIWRTSECANCVPTCTYVRCVRGSEGLQVCLSTLLSPGLALVQRVRLGCVQREGSLSPLLAAVAVTNEQATQQWAGVS